MLQIRTTINSGYTYLDLYKNEPVFLSLSFAELQDVTKKNSNFSKSFSLPGSKKNNEVFNFFYDLNSVPTTFNPNNKFEAVLMWDGYEIMQGNIRLNGVSTLNGEIIYQVTFYNQVGDLMANIGDKFLWDLDLNYLNHPYSQDVVLYSLLDPNLFPLTGTTNYSYQDGRTMWGLFNIGYEYLSANTINNSTTPLVQFSPQSTNGAYVPIPGFFDFSGTPVHDYYFKPAIQIKELYEEIVREAGYTVQSDFFETSYFKNFYMPLKFVDETIYSRNAIPACYTYTNGDLGSLSPSPALTYTDPTQEVACNTLGFIATPSSLTIQSAYTGTYRFQFTFTINPEYNCDYDIGPNYINFYVTDGITTTLLYGTDYCQNVPQQVSFVQPFTFTGTSTLSFYFQGMGVQILNYNQNIVNGPRFIPDGSIINYDIEFPPNDYKQIDFITSINKYYNLIVVPNPDKPNNLIIEPIVDYIGKGPILDWTTKVDFSQLQSVYPTSALLNGTLEYEFKLDQDYANQDFKGQVNRIFGTDKFQLGQEYKDTTTKFDYIFSSPIDITINNSNVSLLTLSSMSKLKQVDISGQTQQTFVPFKILPKVVYRGLTLPNDNYGFLQLTGVTSAITNCNSGITITAIGTGYIKYDDCAGNTTYQYVNNGGVYNYYSQCLNPTSFRPGFPLSNIATPNVTNAGSPCTTVTNQQVYQKWFMNGFAQDRFLNMNRFTTYPFAYTGFSHYINFRGEDQSNITPAEYVFDSEDLYNIYYEPYVNDIISEENKIFATKIYLYPQDVQKLRWNEKVLINNSYFRINKITNWNALEPSICDIELVKLTKDYPSHNILYYDLIPCAGGETRYSNSDLNYHLYAYAGNYVTLYDDALNYLGCHQVQVGYYNPSFNYQHYYISSGYTPNLVNAFPDCGCTGRTPFDIVQEEPGIPRYFWYTGMSCSDSATTYTFKSTSSTLLSGATSYKIQNTATTVTECVYQVEPSFINPTNYVQILSAYTNCNDCNYIPPSATPTQTPSNTPTPSITPTISLTPSITPSPTQTPNPYCYRIQGSTIQYGECYYCPNTYASQTNWYINFFDGCNGNQIASPLNMNVIAHYSDGSTENTFIPAGGTGDFYIAQSQEDCGFPPECTQYQSPTFEYAEVIPVSGTITECCTGPTPTPVTPTPTSTIPPTPTPTSTKLQSATLVWTYSVLSVPTNYMYLYVNGNIVESRSNTSAGNYTVYVGDVINIEVGCSGCDGFNNTANAYCTGIINDANCAVGTTYMLSGNYTVVSGDVGNALYLNAFAVCDSGCL